MGTGFEILKTASGYASTPTALVSFCELANCADGAQPNGGLLAAANGNLFGTTFGTPKATCGGCADSCGGTVFEITDRGFVPHKFDGTPGSPSCFERSVSALAQQYGGFIRPPLGPKPSAQLDMQKLTSVVGVLA